MTVASAKSMTLESLTRTITNAVWVAMSAITRNSREHRRAATGRMIRLA